MIEITLIPDGSAKIPAEARDHSVLASMLEAADPPDQSDAPSWRNIERVISGSNESVVLRIRDATLNDYADSTLDAYATAVGSINGLKKHPDGWTEVEQS